MQGRRIFLDAEQPFPQVVSEEFLIVPTSPAGPVVSEAVEDEIRVWEYPTPVPEPTAGWLLVSGSVIAWIATGRCRATRTTHRITILESACSG